MTLKSESTGTQKDLPKGSLWTSMIQTAWPLGVYDTYFCSLRRFFQWSINNEVYDGFTEDEESQYNYYI